MHRCMLMFMHAALSEAVGPYRVHAPEEVLPRVDWGLNKANAPVGRVVTRWCGCDLRVCVLLQ